MGGDRPAAVRLYARVHLCVGHADVSGLLHSWLSRQRTAERAVSLDADLVAGVLREPDHCGRVPVRREGVGVLLLVAYRAGTASGAVFEA